MKVRVRIASYRPSIGIFFFFFNREVFIFLSITFNKGKFTCVSLYIVFYSVCLSGSVVPPALREKTKKLTKYISVGYRIEISSIGIAKYKGRFCHF